MKIYYASQSFYPHIGGVSTYLLNLIKRMKGKGNEVVELHLRPAGEESEDEISGVKVYRVPKEPINKEIMAQYSKFKEAVYTESHYNQKRFTKPANEMEGFAEFHTVNEYFGEEIRALLEDEPADIVHIHDFQLLFAYRYVPRGTPLILTWHIPFIKNMSRPLKEFLVKHMNEFDKVIFSSQEYINAAVKAGLPEKKAELIHPIANTDLFRRMDIDVDKVKKKYRLPKGKIILCVQRVDPKSGHEQLIRAMPDILKEVPDAYLVFVGGESLSNKLSTERAKLREHIDTLIRDLKLSDHVLFTGTIDYHDLPEVYNAADLVALCSKNEGFGLSVTEGMACHNPIVGTRVGGIPEQVEHKKNGFLVKVGDWEATADAITKILSDDDLRERMAERSLEIVDEKFKIDRGVERHLILYENLRQYKDEFHNLQYFKKSDIHGIISDLDRTLTDKPGKPEFDASDYDAKLFRELRKLDIDLFLSTGRVLSYVKKLCRKFNVFRAAIAENGSVIYFPGSKKTLTFNTYYMTKVKKIIKKMELDGVVIGKVIASVPERYEEQVMDAIGKYAEHVSVIRNVDELMFLPKGVDKGVGVRLAMRYLDIELDNTLVLGDGENDADMFMNPGYKIAVANAHEKIKEMANHVTKKPSTKGVREIIEMIND